MDKKSNNNPSTLSLKCLDEIKHSEYGFGYIVERRTYLIGFTMIVWQKVDHILSRQMLSPNLFAKR